MTASQRFGAGLITPQLEEFVNHHWSDEAGAVDGHDIRFLASLLDEFRPKTVVEIGCASGFSTAALALMMDQLGPGRLHSFDIATRFYADPSKLLGFLLEEVLPLRAVNVALHPGKTSLDVAAVLQGARIDLCFIDACHAHPWPTLDTLAVLPLMAPGGLIVHHDLRMYQDTRPGYYACGPKIVLDQVPPRHRVWFSSRAGGAAATASSNLKSRPFGGGNIFGIKLPETPSRLARDLAQGFYLPWDPLPDAGVPDQVRQRFSEHLAASFARHIGEAFDRGVERYNPAGAARRSRLPGRLASGLAAGWRNAP